MSGAGGPAECPGPPHSLSPGTCFTNAIRRFAPLRVGVTDFGGSTLGYDVASLIPDFEPQSMVIGRGVFISGGGSGRFEIGSAEVGDGSFRVSVPTGVVLVPTVLCPEPATGLLLALGLVGLGARRRAA